MVLEIPFFGVAREFAAHRDDIMDKVESVLRSGQVLQGPAIPCFENKVAQLVGRRHAVAVNSCTDALYFSLAAAGVGRGDEVLVTDFSFVASASCISRLGAIPVFVDADSTYNIDLGAAASRITSKTRAMIVVHLYGQMVDPVGVDRLADEHDLLVIEDAGQAFGAEYNRSAAGSLGNASCFSFDPTKPISAPGGGGMVLTDDDGIAERVRMMRYHGKDSSGEFAEIGFNSQMTSVAAAVLDFKLDRNEEWLRHRRDIAQYYIERLSQFDLVLPLEQPGASHTYHKFTIKTDARDALRERLHQQHIPSNIYYDQPLHRLPSFRTYRYRDEDYPNTVDFSSNVLSLPIHPFLTDAEVEAIVSAIQASHDGNR